MKPTSAQIYQFAREIVLAIRNFLHLSPNQVLDTGWMSRLSEKEMAELRAETLPIIQTFAHKFPK